MTVMELHNELVKLILHGHADTRCCGKCGQWYYGYYCPYCRGSK